MNTSLFDCPVVLIQSGMDHDAFQGVDRLLAAKGIACARVVPDQPPPRLSPATRVVLVSETVSMTSRVMIRQAIRVGGWILLVRSSPESAEAASPFPRQLADRLVCVDPFHGEPRTEPARSILRAVLGRLAQGTTEAGSPRPSDAGLLCRAMLPNLRRRSTRPVVVNCVLCQDSPVGGVSTWAMRLARGFADRDLGFAVRTLFISSDPQACDTYRAELPADDVTDLCVIDPVDDQAACLRDVRTAIERVAGGCAPAIVMPNYSDITYAASMQLSRHGTRVLSIAHTDDAYYRSLARAYPRVDGVVGVSRACMSWLRSTIGPAMETGGIPSAQIVYGVPIAKEPRTVDPEGPLTLAYIGRMVQTQKRLWDLLRLADELEALGIDFVLHMIGDGADLAGWRRAWESRGATRGRVEFHGRRDPSWVQAFLSRIDVSVLVSEAEGTSITMLEAMGAGVVPAVTAVSSGVDEWVTDGVTGVVAPVGAPEEMARRLAALSRDRAGLACMGRAAWTHARDRVSVEAMCERYATLFREMMSRPRGAAGVPACDQGLRLNESWRWSKTWSEDPGVARDLLDRWLEEAGYVRPAWGTYRAGCDAVIIDTERTSITPALTDQIGAWRAEGLGVVAWPSLLCPGPESGGRHGTRSAADRLVAAAEEAVADGCRRLVVYGIGKHTRRVPEVFSKGLPFVGLMDDRLPPWNEMFGLPLVRCSAVMQELRPDAVILSSDAWEEAMWEKTEPLRSAGVRVVPLYGRYERACVA